MDKSGWSMKPMKEMERLIVKNKLPRARSGFVSFDEVKIKEGVVFDPHTGELIGENIIQGIIPRLFSQ